MGSAVMVAVGEVPVVVGAVAGAGGGAVLALWQPVTANKDRTAPVTATFNDFL
jgi:hypothetical protein